MEIKTGAFTSEQLTVWQAETDQKATKIAVRTAPKCIMEAQQACCVHWRASEEGGGHSGPPTMHTREHSLRSDAHIGPTTG